MGIQSFGGILRLHFRNIGKQRTNAQYGRVATPGDAAMVCPHRTGRPVAKVHGIDDGSRELTRERRRRFNGPGTPALSGDLKLPALLRRAFERPGDPTGLRLSAQLVGDHMNMLQNERVRIDLHDGRTGELAVLEGQPRKIPLVHPGIEARHYDVRPLPLLGRHAEAYFHRSVLVLERQRELLLIVADLAGDLVLLRPGSGMRDTAPLIDPGPAPVRGELVPEARLHVFVLEPLEPEFRSERPAYLVARQDQSRCVDRVDQLVAEGSAVSVSMQK